MNLPDPRDIRLQLLQRVHSLPDSSLPQLASYLDSLMLPTAGTLSTSGTSHPHDTGASPVQITHHPVQRHWPHAPLHPLTERGTYFVTGATLDKEHHFRSATNLTALEDELLSQAHNHGWQLEAWAVFSNHYHFVANKLEGASELSDFISRLHAQSARDVNIADRQPGRTVWFNYWDTQLTFEKSYFARLNYVHQNAVRHGLVRVANQYRWCSAAWFERTAMPAQVATIYSFKTDLVKVMDLFEPVFVVDG